MNLNNNNLSKTASIAFMWNQGLYIVSTIILGFTTYILARYLAPQSYGIYSAVMAFGSLASLFISFGFEGALNVHLPRLSNSKPELRYLFRQMLVRRVIIIISFSMLILILAPLFKNLWLPANIRKLDNFLYLAVICGLISLTSGLTTRVLITLFRIKHFAGIRMTYLTLNLMLYFVLLVNGYGIREILWTTIATSSLTLILYVYACRDLLIGSIKKFSLIKIHKFGITIWTTSILSVFLGKELDIIIMTICGVSLIHIGFYQIVFILVAYARILATKGMTGVLQSAFSSAYHTGGIKSVEKWWRITIKFQIMVVAPGVLFLILFARQLFENLLPQYVGATLLLQIYGSFALIITVLGGGTHITAFYAIGKEKIVLYTRTLAGVLNLILDIILIYYFGVWGAIIATGLAGIIVGYLELNLIYTNMRSKYPSVFLLKCFLCLIFSSFAAYNIPISNLLMLVVCAFFYYSVYLVSAWFIKPLEKEDITHLSAVNFRLSRYLIPFSSNSAIVTIESL